MLALLRRSRREGKGVPTCHDTARAYLDVGITAVARRIADARRARAGRTWYGRAAGMSDRRVAEYETPPKFGQPRLAPFTAAIRALGWTLDGLVGMPVTSAPMPPRYPALQPSKLSPSIEAKLVKFGFGLFTFNAASLRP
jgi:hypothetical protein